MRIRRLISFIVLLPAWPFSFLAAMIDDDFEVESVAWSFIEMVRHLFGRE